MTCAIQLPTTSTRVFLQQRDVLGYGHKRLWSSLSRCQLTLGPFSETSSCSGLSTTAAAASASQVSQIKQVPAEKKETPQLAAALLDKGLTDLASRCMMPPCQDRRLPIRLTLAALLKAHQEWY